MFTQLTFGHPVCYGPEGAGGGGDAGVGTGGDGSGQQTAGTGGDGTGGAPPQGVVAPWSQTQDVWSVGDKPWWDSITEEPVRELMSQKAYKNPAELAMAYHSANRLLSGSGHVVELPGENATPEQLDAFYSKLGRPATKDAYEFNFGENAQVDDKFVDFGKNVAFKLGLNAKQAQQLADEWQAFAPEYNNEQLGKAQQDNEAALNEIKTKWGDEFDTNVEAGKRVYQSLGLDQDLVGKIEAGIGAAPLMELLARIGKASAEGGLVANNGGSGNGGDGVNSMTPQQAAAEITRLNGDAQFQDKYTNRAHPENRQAVERMNALFARAGSHAPG